MISFALSSLSKHLVSDLSLLLVDHVFFVKYFSSMFVPFYGNSVDYEMISFSFENEDPSLHVHGKDTELVSKLTDLLEPVILFGIYSVDLAFIWLVLLFLFFGRTSFPTVFTLLRLPFFGPSQEM